MMSPSHQWQQDANRHSQLVDPVVTIQELSRFKPLRTTRIDYALVFTTAHGDRDTYLPPNRPSRTELATRRWTSVYEVDMGLHEAEGVLALPSSDDAFLFEVSLNCSWQVAAPADFVASGERNVPAMVQRLVDGLVRPVLRGHAMEDSAAAEREAQRALAAAGPLGAEAGLHVRCGIQIRRDEAALEHARELRAIEYARQKLDPRHALLMREDELAQERALAQSAQQHRLDLQNQNLGHERELVRAGQELELQEIEARKIAYYAYYLERGGPSAMAFQLARRPEDTRLIMENLREDQLRAMNNQLQVVMQALSGGPGGLEEHQLDEPRRLAVQMFREILTAKLAPAPVTPQVPQQALAAAEGPADAHPGPGEGEGTGRYGVPAPAPASDARLDSAQGKAGSEGHQDAPVPPVPPVRPEEGPLFGYPAPPAGR